MIVKIRLKLTFFILEECYKNQIIESEVKPNYWWFKTDKHTFIYKDNDNEYNTNGYDLIEIDFTGSLLWGSTKEDILNKWTKFDSTKQYFAFWGYGEGISSSIDNFKLLLDLGVKVLSSTWEQSVISHPNYIYDLGFSLHYFNFYNGSCYTDRTNSAKSYYDKKHKVGMYGLSPWKKNGATNRDWRNEYLSYFDNRDNVKMVAYSRPSMFELSQFQRNQHFSMPFDFRDCSYFLTAESHFNKQNHFPYFTSEKLLKGTWLELFDINFMMITSPMHMKDLHDNGFWFANSKFITDYTAENVLNSIFECYETNEIIETSNLKNLDRILSENLFEKHNIL